MENTITNQEIINIRKKLELTQEEFAALLKVNIKTIERWESGGIKANAGASLNNFIELRNVIKDPTAFKTITDIFKSENISVALVIVASLVSIFNPIITGGIISGVVGATIFNKLKDFLNEKNN